MSYTSVQMHTHSDSISTYQMLGHTSPHEQGRFPSLLPFFEEVDPSSPPETKATCHISVFSSAEWFKTKKNAQNTPPATESHLLATLSCWKHTEPKAHHPQSILCHQLLYCTMQNIASSCVKYIYLGGKIEWRISSVGVLVCFSSNLSVFAPPLAAIEVETSVGSSYKTKDAIEGIIILERASSS